MGLNFLITGGGTGGVFPSTIASAAHKWLDSYNAVTGLFTQTQPDYSDLTGTPQLAQTIAAVSHKFLTSYTSSTGAFTAAQPSAADLSDGTTGTGSVMLSASPTTTGTLTAAIINASSNVGFSSAVYIGGAQGTSNVAQLQFNTAQTTAGVTGTLLGLAYSGNAWVAQIDTSGNMGLAGFMSAVSGFKVNNVALAASHLSNGTTGSGAVALAGSPTFTTQITTPQVAFSSGTTLVEEAVNFLAQKNGTNAQTFRVYGNTTGSKYTLMMHDGTNAIVSASSGATFVRTETAAAVILGVNTTAYWQLDSATGNLLAWTDNSNDIGASGASRPRTCYLGTSLDVAGSKAIIGSSGTITKYNNISTTKNGVPAIYATAVDLTTQQAAISATTLFATGTAPGAGMYRISYVATVTQAATTSSTLGPFTIQYTDADTNVVKTSPGTAVTGVNQNSTNSTSTGTISGDIIVNAKASTNIQYVMGYTNSGATKMQYNLHISCEYLG